MLSVAFVWVECECECSLTVPHGGAVASVVYMRVGGLLLVFCWSSVGSRFGSPDMYDGLVMAHWLSVALLVFSCAVAATGTRVIPPFLCPCISLFDGSGE